MLRVLPPNPLSFRSPCPQVSSRDILSEWRREGRAAKYAQCYIFASIQNSLLRSIGVGTRQLSAFDARIDETSSYVCIPLLFP